jgi:hypothetical protein
VITCVADLGGGLHSCFFVVLKSYPLTGPLVGSRDPSRRLGRRRRIYWIWADEDHMWARRGPYSRLVELKFFSFFDFASILTRSPRL